MAWQLNARRLANFVGTAIFGSRSNDPTHWSPWRRVARSEGKPEAGKQGMSALDDPPSKPAAATKPAPLEAPTSSAGDDEQQHTWVSLLVDLYAFVWPPFVRVAAVLLQFTRDLTIESYRHGQPLLLNHVVPYVSETVLPFIIDFIRGDYQRRAHPAAAGAGADTRTSSATPPPVAHRRLPSSYPLSLRTPPSATSSNPTPRSADARTPPLPSPPPSATTTPPASSRTSTKPSAPLPRQTRDDLRTALQALVRARRPTSALEVFALVELVLRPPPTLVLVPSTETKNQYAIGSLMAAIDNPHLSHSAFLKALPKQSLIPALTALAWQLKLARALAAAVENRLLARADGERDGGGGGGGGGHGGGHGEGESGGTGRASAVGKRGRSLHVETRNALFANGSAPPVTLMKDDEVLRAVASTMPPSPNRDRALRLRLQGWWVG